VSAPPLSLDEFLRLPFFFCTEGPEADEFFEVPAFAEGGMDMPSLSPPTFSDLTITGRSRSCDVSV
jgi:hypothetical protein